MRGIDIIAHTVYNIYITAVSARRTVKDTTMSDVMIIEEKKENGAYYLKAYFENSPTYEIYVSSSLVTVCCKNAANRAWGGLGKKFPTIENALTSYKSAAAKAIIAYAIEASK
jgi:hypothetical protein